MEVPDYKNKRDLILAENGVRNYRRWIDGLQSYEEIMEDILLDETAGDDILLEDFEKLKEIYKKTDLSSIIRYFERENERLQKSIILDGNENYNVPFLGPEIKKKRKHIRTRKLEENKENGNNNSYQTKKFKFGFPDKTGGKTRHRKRMTRKTRK